MPTPFSELVASAPWRAQAEKLDPRAGDRVRWAGRRRHHQPRIRPWSTQLVVPTDGGRLWFKANCPALAFEPAVHAALARLDPGEVDAPFAVDAERGWVVTRDRGVTLGDSHEATLADWQAVVRVAARLQRRLADHGAELLAAGLPELRAATVPARFADLVEGLSALPAGHPSHLDVALLQRSARIRPRRCGLGNPAAGADADVVPGTGYLHLRQRVRGRRGSSGVLRPRGRTVGAHPLESLAVPWGWGPSADRRCRGRRFVEGRRCVRCGSPT